MSTERRRLTDAAPGIAPLVLCLSLMAGPTPTWANEDPSDATRGRLFGYTVGDSFPATPGAAVRDSVLSTGYFREIVPVEPPLPDDVDALVLLTSVESRTIISISTENRFPSAEAADVFATRYAALFKDRYGDAGLNKTIDYQRYRAVIADRYLLTINVYLEDDRSAMTVKINLKDHGGDRGEGQDEDQSPLVAQAVAEWNAAVKRNAEQRRAAQAAQEAAN